MDYEKLIKEYDVRQMVKFDLIGKLKTLLNKGGYVLRPEDGKIVIAIPSKVYDGPWIYTRPDPDKNCALWHRVLFNLVEVFPTKCLDCWKVVVRPKTVKQLIALLEVQETLYPGFCKCGIEVRKYVHGNYGGYFYNSSKEEGLESYRIVRALVDEHLSTGVDVTLKRYCTEFELKFGPSNEIEATLERGFFINDEGKTVTVPTRDEIDIWEGIVENAFDLHSEQSPQPGIVKMHVVKGWFERAYEIGDKTCLEFSNGEAFFTKPITYHEEI